MVWKSDRWQAKVAAVDNQPFQYNRGEKGDNAPVPALEITYTRGDDSIKEKVYEDAEDSKARPRLLVSLTSVTALKDLCETEHAKYDKAAETLTRCRTAYYKELCWLRDQMHMAYKTDPAALARRASMLPDELEVYFFEPENYVDPDTKDYLMGCIRESNRQLMDENAALKEELDGLRNVESNSLPRVIRQLRKDASVEQILRELRKQLLAQADVNDFEETAMDLLNLDPARKSTKGSITPSAGTVSVDQEELETLRRRLSSAEALVEEFRQQLSAGIDVKLERNRAEEERTRADLVQKRAERLEAQQRALEQELALSGAKLGERTDRVQKTVTKLTSALATLSPAASPKRHLVIDTDLSDDANFDHALGHLDSVAAGFEQVAVDVFRELQDLRARLAAALADKQQTKQQQQEQAAEIEKAKAAVRAEKTAEEAQLAAQRAADAETSKGKSEARIKALEAEVEDLKAKLADCRGKISTLRKDLDEATGSNEKMGIKLMAFKDKISKLKDEIRTLKGLRGEDGGLDDDDEEFDLEDFMVPYRKRAQYVTGKPRWELLAEDASCARKRREAMTETRHNFIEPPMVPGAPGNAMGSQSQVSAALQFLSAPVSTLMRGRPSVGHAVQQLQAPLQYQQQQPQLQFVQLQHRQPLQSQPLQHQYHFAQQHQQHQQMMQQQQQQGAAMMLPHHPQQPGHNFASTALARPAAGAGFGADFVPRAALTLPASSSSLPMEKPLRPGSGLSQHSTRASSMPRVASATSVNEAMMIRTDPSFALQKALTAVASGQPVGEDLYRSALGAKAAQTTMETGFHPVDAKGAGWTSNQASPPSQVVAPGGFRQRSLSEAPPLSRQLGGGGHQTGAVTATVRFAPTVPSPVSTPPTSEVQPAAGAETATGFMANTTSGASSSTGPTPASAAAAQASVPSAASSQGPLSPAPAPPVRGGGLVANTSPSAAAPSAATTSAEADNPYLAADTRPSLAAALRAAPRCANAGASVVAAAAAAPATASASTAAAASRTPGESAASVGRPPTTPPERSGQRGPLRSASVHVISSGGAAASTATAMGPGWTQAPTFNQPPPRRESSWLPAKTTMPLTNSNAGSASTRAGRNGGPSARHNARVPSKEAPGYLPTSMQPNSERPRRDSKSLSSLLHP